MPSNAAYRKLETWQVAMEFVERCYKATRTFPREELYGLTSQMRRAAVSIPSNVAEGYCRRKMKAYANHVSIALGSHAEVETHVEIAFRLGFVSEPTRDALDRDLASVGRLLSALHRSLEEQIRREDVNHAPRRIP
jgi:four helix bundle protein